MLLKPSCLELMEKINKEENRVVSPYEVVVIVSKCARQVNKNKKPVEENRFIHIRNGNDVKAISAAIEKLLDGKIKIMASSD